MSDPSNRTGHGQRSRTSRGHQSSSSQAVYSSSNYSQNDRSSGSEAGPSGYYDRNEPQGYTSSYFGSSNNSLHTVHTTGSRVVPVGGSAYGGGASQPEDLVFHPGSVVASSGSGGSGSDPRYFRPGSSLIASSQTDSGRGSNVPRPPSSRYSNPSRRGSGYVPDPPRPGSRGGLSSNPTEMLDFHHPSVGSSAWYAVTNDAGRAGAPEPATIRYPVGGKSWEAAERRRAYDQQQAEERTLAARAAQPGTMRRIFQKSKEEIDRRLHRKKR